MATKYVCNGAICTCDQGSVASFLDIKSQNKNFIQDKLVANDNDITFKPPFFVTCKLNQNNPCNPDMVSKWENPANNVYVGNKKKLLETSTLKCKIGGKITITDSMQTGAKIVIFDDYSPSEDTKIKKIISAVWMNADLKDNIQNASYNEKVSLLIKTINYEIGDTITVIIDEKEGNDLNNTKEILLKGTVNENGFAELKESIEIKTTKQN